MAQALTEVTADQIARPVPIQLGQLAIGYKSDILPNNLQWVWGICSHGIPTSENVGLLTTAPLGMGAGEERESRSPFRVHVSRYHTIILLIGSVDINSLEEDNS